MNSDFWQHAIRHIWGVTPYSVNDLQAGCNSECNELSLWPVQVVAGMTYAAYLLVFIVAQVRWQWPTVTSGRRCPPCNRRRGGAERSRHMAQEGGGLPYGGFDFQWPTTAQPQRLYQLARTGELQDAFRRWIGADVGVGLIFYGRRIHADVRERDYLEKKPGAF